MAYQGNVLSKTLVIGIIFLFIVLSIHSSTGYIVEKTSSTVIGSPGYIQDLIDNASDGDTIYISSGTYYENIVIDKSINLIGEDKETTVIDGNYSGNVVYIVADRVNISGFAIQNSGDEFFDAGLDINSKYNTITDNSILDNYFGVHFKDSSNNTIKENNISSNNEVGIFLADSSTNNSIIGNTLSNNYNGIISFGELSTKNSITGNIISNNDLGIYLASSSNNTIAGNFFFNDGLLVVDTYHNIIENNMVNGKPLVYLEKKSDYIITDAGQVVLVNCHNITVENLNFSDTDVVIELLQTNNCYIRNNVCSNNLLGIYLIDSYSNTITENNISSNKYGGIALHSYNNNTIYKNKISNNDRGIVLDYSNSYTITENNINSNKYDGIFLFYSSNNTVMGNSISNNEDGIQLMRSSNNTIYHNNIINNTKNAYDDGNNIWDNGYPSGGNFWDDYNGTDDDGDGIGDTPYPIPDGDNMDRFPLGNFPPDRPNVDGPPSGKPGVEYRWVFHSEDPECLSIYYYIDWGDGNITDWFGPYPSGMPVEGCHKYEETGFYVIGAKVKDIYDAESNWTYFDIEIETPRTRATIYSLFQLFFDRFPFLEVFLRTMNLLR